MKTTTRLISIVAIAMVLSIAFSGVALACCPVPETTCTSRIETTTEVTCLGTMTEDESLNFRQSSEDIANNPPLAGREVYADTRYSEDLTARAGYISFGKSLDFDSANSDGVPDVNLDVAKSFDYAATPNAGGGLTFDEMVAIDAISRMQRRAPTMCPFALPAGGGIPESCEYVTAGSTLDVTEVSLTSNTQTITTAMSSDTTPITMHYDVRAGDTLLTPNTLGAVGSASAFMTVHDMEGRRIPAAGQIPARNTLGSDLEFNEMTTVDGIFELYKDMDYVSGILLP